MNEQTTIIGRPTYMAMFTGAQEAAPIMEKLTAAGYPADDIAILLRPPGTDSVLDLLSDENAAGQDADVRLMLEKHQDKLQDACTIVILHPEPGQLEAVRAALTGMGAQEFDYEPETRYSGAQSEADFARATVGSVGLADNTGLGGTVAPGPSGTTPPGTFQPSPANATSDAPAAPEAPAHPAAPPPDTHDLQAEIARLEGGVEQVKRELQQND